MNRTPRVVLDACVLANFSLCDTLLRLAESPRLFEPKWSEEIILETIRTLESKLGWPRPLCVHFEGELRRNFGEAWISGHDGYAPAVVSDRALRAGARAGFEQTDATGQRPWAQFISAA